MAEATDITVRRAEPEDYLAVQRLFSGNRSVAGTLQLPYPSAQRWRKRLAEPDQSLHHLLGCAGNEVVGQLSLQVNLQQARRSHSAHIGINVHDDWQGRGVGLILLRAGIELADRWLNLVRLELSVFTDNESAIKLYRKFGFEIEGTHRQYAFRDGGFVDAYSMARISPSAGR